MSRNLTALDRGPGSDRAFSTRTRGLGWSPSNSKQRDGCTWITLILHPDTCLTFFTSPASDGVLRDSDRQGQRQDLFLRPTWRLQAVVQPGGSGWEWRARCSGAEGSPGARATGLFLQGKGPVYAGGTRRPRAVSALELSGKEGPAQGHTAADNRWTLK